MTIYKILNNNLILSKDKQGHAVLHFRRKKGSRLMNL